MSAPAAPVRVSVVTGRRALAEALAADADLAVAGVAERPDGLTDGAEAVLVDARADLDAALRLLRDSLPDVPVVAVGVPSEAAHRAHRLGYDGVFPAGVEPAGRIGGVVRRALASRALERSELIAELARRDDVAAATDASLRALVDAHHDGMLVVDPEGTVRFANPAARALLGSGRQLEGTAFGLPLTGRAVHDVDLVVDGEPVVAELRTVDITWDGHASVLCLLRDVTERRRHEELLRQAEALLAAVLATVPDALVELDEEGAVRRWSDAAATLLGWTAEQVMARPCPFLEPAEVADLAGAERVETRTVPTRDHGTVRVRLTSRPEAGGALLLVLSLL